MYTGAGIEEGQFQDAKYNVGNLISAYQQCQETTVDMPVMPFAQKQ